MKFRPAPFVLTYLVFFANIFWCMSSLNVQVIILILGEDVNFGYYATAPMYDVAFERASARYPHLLANTSRHVLYQRNVKDCGEAAANMISLAGSLIDFVQDHAGLTVLLAPGCSLEMMVLADFARGRGAQVPALKVFLEKYSLTTATVLCENPLNYLYAQGYLGMICRTIKSQLSTSNRFVISYEEIDSVRKPHYEAALTRAKQRSRVIIIETREDVVRQVMVRTPEMVKTVYPELGAP
ncbi:hypothetical protein RvY_11279 [Ramazzottius varieornatus]|uniref:Receptor ligand binding region domain-containing protein n=1 Tax=Ramazzottius varieornatus TaxID=947166 RepID=A0A1D1VFM8_RAMVA|nr:hypothetical protein RvY_11279 [Ramazzottius varieornatus]